MDLMFPSHLEKPWLGVREAVLCIAAKLSADLPAAQTKLIEACALGEVLSRYRVAPAPNEQTTVTPLGTIPTPWWWKIRDRIQIGSGPERDNNLQSFVDNFAEIEIDARSLQMWLQQRLVEAKQRSLITEMLSLAGPLESLMAVLSADDAKGSPKRELRLAPKSMIHDTISEVYDEAKMAGQKPPNVKEIVAPVRKRLSHGGYEASGRRIQQLADDDRHKSRRRKPGPTVAREKRRQAQ